MNCNFSGIDKLLDELSIFLYQCAFRKTKHAEHSKLALKTDSEELEEAKGFLTYIRNETELLFEELKKTAYGIKKEKHIKVFVNNQQKALFKRYKEVKYLQSLYIPPDWDDLTEKEENPRITILFTLEDQLHSMIEFLYQDNEQYIDKNMEVLPSYYDYIYIRYEKIIKLLEGKIECKLCTIVLESVSKIQPENEHKLSYNALGYLIILLDHIVDKHYACDLKNNECGLLKRLYEHNFNNENFYVHEVEKLKQKLEASETEREKLGELQTYQKMLNQVQEIPGMVYDETKASITDRMKLWVEAEISYIEQESFNNSLGQPDKHINDSTLPNKRLIFNGTVRELATILRLLKLSGAILGDKIESLIANYLSITFQTKGSETPTTNGFKKHLYNKPSQRTIDRVRKILMDMLYYLKKLEESDEK